MVFEVVVNEGVLVLVVVVAVLFPGKLMTVDEVDAVDVPLPEFVPVVTVVVAVLRRSKIGQFQKSQELNLPSRGTAARHTRLRARA